MKSNSCSNGGTPLSDSLCDCPSGWAGPFCDYRNMYTCTSVTTEWCLVLVNIVLKSRTLIAYQHDAIALLDDDDVCVLDNPDECASSPCAHGACADYIGSYQCTCDAGYTGTQCSGNKTHRYCSCLLHGIFMSRVTLVLLQSCTDRGGQQRQSIKHVY